MEVETSRYRKFLVVFDEFHRENIENSPTCNLQITPANTSSAQQLHVMRSIETHAFRWPWCLQLVKPPQTQYLEEYLSPIGNFTTTFGGTSYLGLTATIPLHWIRNGQLSCSRTFWWPFVCSKWIKNMHFYTFRYRICQVLSCWADCKHKLQLVHAIVKKTRDAGKQAPNRLSIILSVTDWQLSSLYFGQTDVSTIMA